MVITAHRQRIIIRRQVFYHCTGKLQNGTSKLSFKLQEFPSKFMVYETHSETMVMTYPICSLPRIRLASLYS
jgi:hypothetical protein